MAIIADILTQVDAAATAVGATAFDAVAAEIVPVFRVGSVLVVALVGINLMAQAVPMTLRNGLGLMVRIAVASAFLSSWTNFSVNRHAKLTPYRRPKLTPLAASRSGPEPTELITEWRRVRP